MLDRAAVTLEWFVTWFAVGLAFIVLSTGAVWLAERLWSNNDDQRGDRP